MQVCTPSSKATVFRVEEAVTVQGIRAYPLLPTR